MNYLKIYVFFLSISFSNIYAAAEKNALDSFLEGFKTFSGSFEQSLIDVSGEVLETSNGTLYLKYPGQFHWKYVKPYAQSLISDGKKLWVYDEDLEQVTIKDVNEELDNTPAAILSGKDTLYQYFKVINQSSNSGINIIELAPNSEDNQFHSVKLSFIEERLVQMTLFDKLGQITDVTFSNVKRNTNLDDTLFSFSASKDIDVIDASEVLN